MKNQKLKLVINNNSSDISLTQEEELKAITDLLTKYVNDNCITDPPTDDSHVSNNTCSGLTFEEFIMHRFTKVL